MRENQTIQNTFTQGKYILSILLVCAISISSFAQDVSVKTITDKKQILIGDQISLQYIITFNPQKFRVQLPILADTFNKFEIVERKKIDTSEQRENITLTQASTLTHFDSGAWVIPPQTFGVTPLDGAEAFEIKSDPAIITVNTIDADTSKPIKPIFEIIAAHKSFWETWKNYFLGGLGILLFVGLLYYYFKYIRKKKGGVIVDKKVYVTPWDNAAQKIESLVSKELWLRGQEKDHHTDLTDCIRTYLEDGFGLDCFEKTSQEIITDVKKYLQKNKYKKRSEELVKLRNIFETADLVKFAKSKPTELEHQQSNEDAISFVRSSSIFLQNELKKQTQKPATK